MIALRQISGVITQDAGQVINRSSAGMGVLENIDKPVIGSSRDSRDGCTEPPTDGEVKCLRKLAVASAWVWGVDTDMASYCKVKSDEREVVNLKFQKSVDSGTVNHLLSYPFLCGNSVTTPTLTLYASRLTKNSDLQPMNGIIGAHDTPQ